MKKHLWKYIFILLLFLCSGCGNDSNLNENSKEEEKEQVTQEQTKKEKILYKYDIEAINYGEISNSFYQLSNAKTRISFEKEGVRNCFMSLKLDGKNYYPKGDYSCTYTKNDTGYTVSYSYKNDIGNISYVSGTIEASVIPSENEKKYTFQIEGKKYDVYNTYYEKFKELGITRVLFDEEKQTFYDTNGLSIYMGCVDDNCEVMQPTQINLAEYKIVDKTDGSSDKDVPPRNNELKYIFKSFIGTCHDAGTFSIDFYKDMSCNISTSKPYHYENEFKDCKYTITKKNKTYQANVSVSIYDDLDKIWEPYKVIFDVHVNENNQPYKISTTSPDANIIFQDYDNFDGYIEMN